jgi:hypothetical protein
MQIPPTWLVYIVPGLFIIISVFVHFDNLKPELFSLLGFGFITVAAYPIGLGLDFFLLRIVRPIMKCCKVREMLTFPPIEDQVLFRQHVPDGVIDALREGYDSLVFMRCMSVAAFVLAASLGLKFYVWASTRFYSPETCLVAMLLIVGAVLAWQYFLKEKGYNDFKGAAFDSVITSSRPRQRAESNT